MRQAFVALALIGLALVGPVERWTYKASNGEVGFVIGGDTVTLQAAGGTRSRSAPGRHGILTPRPSGLGR